MTLTIPPKISNSIPDIEIQFLNTSISANDQIKFLGITIDTRLNFEEHIGIVAKKNSRSLNAMCKLKNVLPSKALLILNYSMIHDSSISAIWYNYLGEYTRKVLKKIKNAPK